jgi:Rrf2 family protein
MRLGAQEEIGLRCLLQVARAQARPEGQASIREVAEAEGLSLEYAAKLLRALRQAGLVESRRGAAGGYTLARPADTISAWEVLLRLDGPLFDGSLCGDAASPACVHADSDCSVRVLFGWASSAVEAALSRITLADLLRGPSALRFALQGDPLRGDLLAGPEHLPRAALDPTLGASG